MIIHTEVTLPLVDERGYDTEEALVFSYEGTPLIKLQGKAGTDKYVPVVRFLAAAEVIRAASKRIGEP